MFFRFIFRPYAKGKPTSLSSWITSYSSSQTPWAKQSKPSQRKPCAPWFAITGPVTFESCKTTSSAASFFLMTASLNQGRLRPVSRRRQRSSTQHLKKRYVEKLLQPARARSGGSGVREGQPPASVL